MRGLPLNKQGYPIPYFVAYVGGEPDFRLMDPAKFKAALKFSKCWLCGQPLGSKASFVVGPMCLTNNLSAEPPSHDTCARYAIEVCPFLTRPKAKRREAGMPDERNEPAGIMVKHNPGVVVLFASRNWNSFRPDAKKLPLVKMGDPISPPLWFTEGRPATYDEALKGFEESIRTVREQAKAEGKDAENEAEVEIANARVYLPDEDDAYD